MAMTTRQAKKKIKKNKRYMTYYKSERAAGRMPKTYAQYHGKKKKTTGSSQHKKGMAGLSSGDYAALSKMRDRRK